MARMKASVHKFSMSDPGDISAIEKAIDQHKINPSHIVAILGKTEGNGGVNDFTRGYFTAMLKQLLAETLKVNISVIGETIPFIFSGGTEGVLCPHYLVFCCDPDTPPAHHQQKRLAIGTAFTPVLNPEAIGRMAQVQATASAVRTAMERAKIASPEDVHFIQIKGPCLTQERIAQAESRGQSVVTNSADHSMAYSRVASALGVALALGEVDEHQLADDVILSSFDLYSSRASTSSGVEVLCNEIILLGNSSAWSSEFVIAHRTMKDALDIEAIYGVLRDLGIDANPQVSSEETDRIAGVLVKCEPDRRGLIRGNRHTMLGDTDINAQRHIRGAVGGIVSAVIGDTQIFVSGGAENQGPDGGGLIAVIVKS